jgi:hypothetical protein
MEETPDIYKALLDGNPDGAMPIWLVWRGPLIVWGLKFLKDRDLVEDAVVDTYTALRERIEPFNDKEHIEAWLHDTVRNKCWTALRKQPQLVPLGDEAAYSSDLAASQSVDIKDSIIMSRQIILLIMKRLKKMPPKANRGRKGCVEAQRSQKRDNRLGRHPKVSDRHGIKFLKIVGVFSYKNTGF